MPVVPAGVALLLGVWGIRRDGSMWRDEAVTEAVAHRTVPEMWGLVQNTDAVHGLYYLLVHGWLSPWDGDDSLVALRLPSVLATVLATAGVAAIGKRLASPRAGLLAGLAYAVMPMVQHYAQEGRSYALVAACVVWATWFLVRAAEENRTRYWVAYAVVALVGCWLNLFAAFALVAHGVALRLNGTSRPVFRAFAVSAAAVAAGTVPLAALAVGQSGGQLGWLSRPGVAEWAGFVAVTSAGVLLTAVKFPVRGPVGLPTLALSLLVVPSGLLIVLSMIKPYYVDRYVMYCVSGLALLVGAAADRAAGPGIRRTFPDPPYRWAAVAMVPATLTVVLAPWHAEMRTPEARKDNVLAVSSAVREVAEPGDAVLFTPARRRDWLLHDPVPYRMLDDIALQETPEASGTLRGTEHPAVEIRERIAAAHRIITLADPEGQPLDQTPQETVKRDALDQYFTECRTLVVHGARVSVWARTCGTEREA